MFFIRFYITIFLETSNPKRHHTHAMWERLKLHRYKHFILATSAILHNKLLLGHLPNFDDLFKNYFTPTTFLHFNYIDKDNNLNRTHTNKEPAMNIQHHIRHSTIANAYHDCLSKFIYRRVHQKHFQQADNVQTFVLTIHSTLFLLYTDLLLSLELWGNPLWSSEVQY